MVSAIDYGVINLEHDTPLPNIVNGQQYHYILANLPITTDGERLASWQFLYQPNSPQAIATQRGNINLHVVRPTDYHGPTDTIRQVSYIHSIPLVGIRSYEIIDLLPYNITLFAGDLLAVSVPDDSVMVRVGANNQGLSIPYGIMSIPLSEDVEIGYEGYYKLSQVMNQELLQLCTKFTTYSSAGVQGNSNNGDNYPHDILIFENNYVMSSGGSITTVSTHVKKTGNNPPSSLKMYIAVGTFNAATSIVTIKSRTLVSGLTNLQTLTLPTPIPVNTGDYVGHYTLSTDNTVSGGSIYLGADTVSTNQVYYSTTLPATATQAQAPTTPTYAKYRPKFTFVVATDIPDPTSTPTSSPTSSPTSTPTSTSYPTVPAVDGCSLGYWKNHVSAWPSPWIPTTPISTMFDTTDWTKVNYASATNDPVSKDTTLLQALQLNGGNMDNVYRQGVAAYFDALVYGSTTTGYTVNDIKVLFKSQAEAVNPAADGAALETKAQFCHGGVTPTDTPTPTPTVSTPTRGNADIHGDPQFSGFQGQSFQFHGLADEHFNLISSPQLQINSHFIYLSSGRCHYNNTVCFQHPGTYVDALGFIIPSVDGDVYIKLVSGSHDEGLRIWMSSDTPDEPTEITWNEYPEGLSWHMNNETTQQATVMYTEFGETTIKTPLLHVRVVNAEYFFNMEMSLRDRYVLRLGRPHHIINDRSLCHHNSHGEATIEQDRVDETSIHDHHDHGKVEQVLIHKYQIDFPLHGLIGQTWRNAMICGKPWIGHVNDYITADLFSSDYYYNMRD